jgi:hypothetical protein
MGALADTMWTASAILSNDGFKKFYARMLVRKSCSQLVDIHNISSFPFWERYYQTTVTNTVTRQPFFDHSAVNLNFGRDSHSCKNSGTQTLTTLR